MTTDAVGGVWRYSVDLCRSLNACGIRVILACLGPAPRRHQAEEVATLPASRLVCLDAPLEWLVSDPRDLEPVPRRIEELGERYGVDLLHLSTPSQAAGLRTRRPVVVVSHSCVVTWWAAMRGTPLPREWAWQFDMNLRGMRHADAVVTPTASHAEALQRAYGRLDRLHVVPNAVTSQHAALAAARRPFAFAAARWWDEGKNAALLDGAAARMKHPVRAAGACHGENGQVFSFAHVQALGALPHHETRRLMREAGIFVSPSLYEPFGLAALEAAEAGAALVLSDIPTYRELWEDAAVFVDPRDAPALAHTLDRLADDEAERLRWGMRARQRATAFTPGRQIQALMAAYGAAIATAHEQSPAE